MCSHFCKFSLSIIAFIVNFRSCFFCSVLLVLSTVTLAQNNVDILLAKVKEAKSDTAKAKLYEQLSYQYAETDTVKAFDFQRKALAIFLKFNHRRGITNNHIAKANIFLTSNHLNPAFISYTAAKDIALKYSYVRELSIAASGMGLIERRRNNLPKALTYFNQAAAYGERAKDKKSVALANRQIANIYNQSKNFKSAKEYMLNTYRIFEEIKDTRSMAEALGSIGFTERNAGHIDSAIYYFNKAVVIFEKLNNQTMTAVAYTEIGKAQAEGGNHQLAIENFLKAFESYRKTQNIAHLDALNIYMKLVCGSKRTC